jgi:MFS transporter, DHA2 family, multidrug resistance protein
VFYINLPVGILSIFMVRKFVFDPSYIRRSEADVDWWGIGMLIVWIGALQVAFDKGPELDWFSSNFITGLVAVTIVFAIAFLVRELMAEHPVVTLSVFKLRSYSTGVFLMTVLGFVLYGSIVLLPIWLQTLLGYPATQAGFTMAPRGIGSMIGMPLVGLFVARFDPRKVLAGGLFLGAVSTWRLAQLNLDVGYWDLFWPQAIQGFGLGMVFVPLTTVAMSPVPREAMGNATSLYNLMRNLGGSMGIAVITMLNTRFRQQYTSILGSHVTATSPQAGEFLGAMRSMYLGNGSGPGLAERKAYGAVFGLVQRQAAMRAFVDLFQLITIVFLLMIPLTLIMRKPKAGGR